MSSDPIRVFQSIKALCYNAVSVDWVNLESNTPISESDLIEQLKSIIILDPYSARSAIVNGRGDDDGRTLLHFAARYRSLEFCKVLVEMDSGLVTVKATDTYSYGMLPIHFACETHNFETAKYLYHIFPESINIPAINGWYLLHCLLLTDVSAAGLEETLRFLLEHDQGAVLKADRYGRLPLHIASQYCDSTVVEIVYNAYPEAIFIRDHDGETPLDVARTNNKHNAVAFFETQLEFVREAREIEIPNEDGELPIHQAFRNENVAKGTIKLMAAANPASLIAINGQGRTPLHIAFACGFDDLDNVKSLVEINEACLTIGDSNQNLPLHIACRFGKSDVVNYILDKTDCGVGVKNDDGVLPIQLLLSNAECDQNSLEYECNRHSLGCCFRLLRIDPELSIQALSENPKNDEMN